MGNAKVNIGRKNHCFQSISNVQDHSSTINHQYLNINFSELNKIQKEFIWKNKN